MSNYFPLFKLVNFFTKSKSIKFFYHYVSAIKKLSWLFIIAVIISPIASAADLNVEPKSMWMPAVGPTSYFGSSEEAFSAVKQYFERPNFTLGNLRPIPSALGGDVTYNGTPAALYWDYTRCQTSGDDCQTAVHAQMTQVLFCPQDYAIASTGSAPSYSVTCKRTVPDTTPSENSCKVGNPISPATGQKYQKEVDYRGVNGLEFVRIYTSTGGAFASQASSGLTDNSAPRGALSAGCLNDSYQVPGETSRRPWCFSYVSGGGGGMVFMDDEGRTIKFGDSENGITQNGDVNDRLIKVTTASGYEWQIRRKDGTVEHYSKLGQLSSKVEPTGQAIYYTYSDVNTPSSIAPKPGLLLSQTTSFGHSLSWSYNSASQMTTMTDPAGGIYKYEYVGSQISKVTYPDNSSKSYLYNEPANIAMTSPTRPYLTGIVDEKANRFATFKYDNNGLAISTEHSGGVEKYSLAYTSLNSWTVVTDPLGTKKTYGFNKSPSYYQDASITQAAGAGSASATESRTFDSNGNIASRVNFRGFKTKYTYNLLRNLEISRTEATGTTQALTTITTWHNDFRKPVSISVYSGESAAGQAVSITAFTYDTAGNELTKTITDSVTSLSRTWTKTYNNFGQMLTSRGPRTDINDTTTYTYYECATGYQCGQLKTVVNALSHTTQYLAYDAHGRPLEVLRDDGSRILLTYDLRGRVKTSKLNNDLTTYTYDATGNLTDVALANGGGITYAYDDAHRLTSVTDKLGNRIELTLDNASNVTKIIARDTSSVLRYQQQKIYDALSRVQNIVDTQNKQTTFLYDANGNPTGVTNPKQHSTSHQFDALDQLKQTTDALSGKTEYSYDAQGNIKAVKDPRGNSTSYVYNAFGDLTSLVSPDTGTTTFTHDTAGNRLSATDARSVVVNYTYDALNRLKTVIYPASSSENITYTYDSTANSSYGIGRLSSIATGSIRNDYVYNYQGLIVKKFTQVDSTLSTTQYSYDTAGNLSTITYPSGRSVTYTRDAAGRIQGITTKANATATAQSIASAITYLPFGPVASYTYGNGLTHTNTFDTDYRLTAIQVGGVLSRGYTYDLADNITGISDGKASSKNQTLGYDALDRLTSAQGIYGTLGYTYDAVGNRLTETASGTTATYTYETTNNRLSSIAKTNANRSFLYDVAGNRIQGTSDALKVQDYTYNNANRLSAVKETNSLVATYKYNALGQRVSKLLASQVQELYHYDEAGHLIAVTDAAGNTTREYIYSGNELLGFIAGQSTAIPTTTITATTNQATLQNAVLATTYSGYTGSAGYIQFNGEGQASWPVTIAATANHTIQISYALASGTRAMDVYVDGVKKTTVSFASTTAWTKWTATSVTLNLTAGNHTLMLKTTGASGPNLDRVRLTPVAGQTTGSASVYYVHNDHKSTPQVVTAQNQSVMWMADYQPFGKLQPNQSNSLELYSRFPGQYVDNETGIYYNYFRDYDPSIGRYIESDPIGLRGGINTYGYTYQNPIKNIDRDGRFVFIAIPGICALGGCEAIAAGMAALTCALTPSCRDAAKNAMNNKPHDDSGNKPDCPPTTPPPPPPMDCDTAMFECQDELGVEFWGNRTPKEYDDLLRACVKRKAPHCV